MSQRTPAFDPALDSALAALLALMPLDDLPRTGWILRGIAAPESVSHHVLGTCFLVLCLGPRVTPALDTERALSMAVLHDVPEVVLGDLPRMAKSFLPAGAKAEAEDKAARALLPPISALALERFLEYSAGRTRESRFVRVCDRLQMGVRLVRYHRLGVRGLEDFAASIADLDCAEFAPAHALKSEILAAVAGTQSSRGGEPGSRSARP